MNLKFFASAVLVTGAALLSSCSGSGRVDVVNPTVTQLDALDVQWGLPKRTTRGGVRRFDMGSASTYNSQSSSSPAPAAAAASQAPASAAPAAAPASPASTIDPNVIKSLR